MSAKVRWLDLLSAVPTTGRDNVVPISNHEPPPIVNTLYREIMQDRDAIAALENQKARLENDLKRATEQAHAIIGKVDAEIAEMREVVTEKQGRWIVLTRNLGIDIQD